MTKNLFTKHEITRPQTCNKLQHKYCKQKTILIKKFEELLLYDFVTVRENLLSCPGADTCDNDNGHCCC